MLDTATAQILLRDDGILSIRIRHGAHQTVSDAEENLASATVATAGQRRPLLVNIAGSQPLDSEVRHRYSGQRLVDGFLALALVVEASALGRMMGNVYFLVARPGIPTRLFTDDGLAVAWLREFLP